MTITKGLVENITLLLSLCLIYFFIYQRHHRGSVRYRVYTGILFGIIAAVGMLFPLHLMKGVIFDGRTIIISVAVFLGGPVTALISASLTMTVRSIIGGPGIAPGLLTIAAAATIGMIYHHLYRGKHRLLSPGRSYLFGFATSAAMMLLMFTMPDSIRTNVFASLTLPIMVLFPPATMLIIWIIFSLEKLIDTQRIVIQHEREARLNLEEKVSLLVEKDILLQEKEILLKEVHHRVKNNMQIITSLLMLQESTIEEESLRNMFKITQHRIMSMALVHEMLYHSPSLTNINMKNFIIALTSQIAGAWPTASITSSVDVDDNHSLTIDKAIPCAMIINELITNAVKHGGQNQQCIITVDMTSPAPDKYRLTIRDNGPGVPDSSAFEKRGSLGVQIVRNLVRQLRGEITFITDNGLVCVVDF
jgi:two-component sensor histidine kinase